MASAVYKKELFQENARRFLVPDFKACQVRV